MDKDITSPIFETVIGLAALIDLLADKGVITEDEYEKKFEEAKNLLVDSVIEEMKKNCGSD